MKICIVGGGNIGTCLSAWLKHRNPDFSIRLYTGHPESFDGTLECTDVENDFTFSSRLDIVSGRPEIAALDAELVFVALPHFAVRKAFEDIAPHVASDAVICILPGCGGCEFFFHEYFTPAHTLCGFQRVPFIARTREYGKSAEIKSWKPYNVVASLQRARIDHVCGIIEKCGLKTRKATNYLEVALTPSNPILHTSRMYELFCDFSSSHVFDSRPKLYADWGQKASETLFAMDAELQKLLRLMEEDGIGTSEIRPLPEHYESPTPEALTRKIRSIPSFQSIYAPFREEGDKYMADLSSRLFTEDFTYGLSLFRAYFHVYGLECPNIDKVLDWYYSYMGEGTRPSLADYGIRSRKDLAGLYLES